MTNLKKVGTNNSCNRNLSLLFAKLREIWGSISTSFAIWSRMWESSSKFLSACFVVMINLIEEVAQKQELHRGRLRLWEVSPRRKILLGGQKFSNSLPPPCKLHYFIKSLLHKDEQSRYTLLQKWHIADINYFQTQKWKKTIIIKGRAPLGDYG